MKRLPHRQTGGIFGAMSCKLDSLKPHNSLKLSFKIIQGVNSNFVGFDSSGILPSYETNLKEPIGFSNFSMGVCVHLVW